MVSVNVPDRVVTMAEADDMWWRSREPLEISRGAASFLGLGLKVRECSAMYGEWVSGVERRH